MARKIDAIDLACFEWAAVRRDIDKGRFLKGSDWLGAMRCSIAEKRDLHAGSRSVGLVSQAFPEVHTGQGLLVSQAYQHMSLQLRESLYVHYVVPLKPQFKIDLWGISSSHYWDRVRQAKTYVSAWMAKSNVERAA